MIYTFLGSLPFSWINVYERRPVYIDFTPKEGIGAKNRKAPPGPCPPLYREKIGDAPVFKHDRDG